MGRETVIDAVSRCHALAALVALLGAGLTGSMIGSMTSCKKSDKTGDKTEPAPDPTPVERPADAAPAREAPLNESEITWIKDDYRAALAAAKEAGKPLVIDMWAPWCHTCISMKEWVLVDKAFAEYAGRFVWVALDTDKETNAAPVAKFPPAAWPTFFVVDGDEQVAARFVGAATVAQFREFLNTGERAILQGAKLEEGSPLWHMREGDRRASENKPAEAAAAYGKALEAAPDDWPRRPDILVSMIGALYKAGDIEGCARLGDRVSETTRTRSASTADFAYYAMSCAKVLPEHQAKAMRVQLLAAMMPILSDASSHLSVDDRSDGWRIAREIYLADGQKDKADEAAKTQRRILDEAADAAHSPFAAMTYNWPRVEVYLYLGVGAELVGDLEQSARDLPDQYDPPYRLGYLYLRLGQLDKALANAERAVELVYGPRKARALSLVADIHEAAGDAKKARGVREQVLAHVESLPDGQRTESLLAWAKKALEPEGKAK